MARRERRSCPPHHWILDTNDYGKCCKCGAERDFRAIQGKRTLQDEMRELKKTLAEEKRRRQQGQAR